MEEKELTRYPSRIAPFTPVRREFLLICDGDSHQAIIISAIDYLVRQRIKYFKDLPDDSISCFNNERLYLAPIAYDDFNVRGISRCSCETAILKLIDRGYIARYIKKDKDKGVYYYRLNYDAINNATAAALKNIKYHRKWTPPPDPNDLYDDYVLCNKMPPESSKKRRDTKLGIGIHHENSSALSINSNTDDSDAACSNF